MTRIVLPGILPMLCLVFLGTSGLAGEHAQEPGAVPPKAMGKVIWDFNISVPLSDTVEYLRGIRRTYDTLRGRGIDPEMVLLLRSFSPEQVRMAQILEERYAQKIQDEANTLALELSKLPGMRIEADAHSIELLAAPVRDRVTVVEDPFLALLDYQVSGFSLIPLYAGPSKR